MINKLLFILVLTAFFCIGSMIAEGVDKPQVMTITGKVIIYKGSDDVYIVQNWKSRSKVSYKVSGKLTDEVKKKKDTVIKVNGIVEKKSEWSGIIVVTEIIKIT